MRSYQLRDLPGSARLAIGLFVALLLAFMVTAQANLWVHDGRGAVPGPDDVLAKYHGSREGSRLHRVLDAGLAPGDPHAMWVYLDPTSDPETIETRRVSILAWVEAGAPESGWEPVRKVLHVQAVCLQCHAYGAEKQDLPLETVEQVRVVAEKGGGMPLGRLLVSAHNHLYAFAVMALLLGLGAAGTRLPARLKLLLVALAFGGAAVDLASWFLTRSFGTPFQYGVLLGGAAFGVAALVMALAVLVEVTRSAEGADGAG